MVSALHVALTVMACRSGSALAGNEPGSQVGGDAFGGMAVPQFWRASALAAPGQDLRGMMADCFDIAANHRVGALLDRDWPLGVFAHGQAGNAEGGCLFLQAAGGGQ